jgi:2-methylcitrate dehydratase
VDLAQKLADYALSVKYRDLDARTVKEMKARIIDAFGCAIGAFNEKPARIARKTVESLGHSGDSTILGTRLKTSPELATFANGLAIRYFDFNDTYLSKEPAHPSDNLAPCFAVAEAEGLTGKDVMASAVVAYEIQCRLCDAADIRHRGWDHVNYGLVSTALASSKLMRLGPKQATHAVNIALNSHVAMRQVRAGELSMWKGASFANAARNGVFSAMLARDGMTGPAPIFEGEMGFFKQVSGPFDLDADRFGGRDGEFKVKDTYVKYWPAEYHAQSAVWAAIEARKRISNIKNVESVLVETHEAGYTILGKDPEKWNPHTKETADHSLPYIVGMALLTGKVDNSTYSDANLHDRANLAFVSKVRVVEDPGLTALYPDRGMANRVTVSLKGGREVTAAVEVPKGNPMNPMTKEDIEKKFLGLTSLKVGAGAASAALKRLWGLEEERDMTDVLGLLAVKQKSNP